MLYRSVVFNILLNSIFLRYQIVKLLIQDMFIMRACVFLAPASYYFIFIVYESVCWFGQLSTIKKHWLGISMNAVVTVTMLSNCL